MKLAYNLPSLNLVLAPHLETGATVDVFHAVGTVPVAIDRLNGLVGTSRYVCIAREPIYLFFSF